MVATILGVMGLPTSANAAEGDIFIDVPTKEIELTTYAPVVANDYIFSIPSKTINLTSYAPAIVYDGIVIVPTKSVNLTAYAPVISTFQTEIIVDVPTKTIQLSVVDETLVDGFENWSGGLPVGWEKPFGVVNQSTSHVTQGIYSVEFGPSVGNTLIRQNPLQIVAAGKYAIDVYLGSGSANVTFNHSLASSLVTSSVLGAQTLILDIPVGGNGQFSLSCSGGSDAFWDNLRYVDSEIQVFTDSVVAVPTKEVELTAYTPSVLIAEYTVKTPTKEIELTAYAPVVFADSYVEVPTKTIELTAYAPVVFISEYILSVPTKDVELTAYAPSINITIRVDIPTKTVELTAYAPRVFADSVVAVPTKEIELITYSPNVDAGFIFQVPTKEIELTAYAPAVGVPFSREYFVIVSSEFNYEILGVDVNSVSGEGTFGILVDGVEIHTDLPFDTVSQNITLSGIINRGQMVKIRIQTLNQLFQSFNARLALKRI